MSQVFSQLVPVALLSIPVAPALSFDFLRHDAALLGLRDFFGAFAPFAIGVGVSLYVFHFRNRRGTKSG